MLSPKPKPVKLPKSKKKRAKPERKVLDAECMALLKEIVRLRDKTCVTPNPHCGGYLTASHWQKRGKQWTRYDLRNISCQCANCNQRHNNYTSYYDAYMLKHYGYEVCLELSERASVNSFKWTLPQLREIRDGLQAEYDKLKG